MPKQGEGLVDRPMTDDAAHRAAIEELYEHTPVGCALVLDDGTIISANLTLATLLDVPRPQLLGTPLLEHLEPDDRLATLQFLSRITPEHGDAPLEVRLRPREASPRVCVLSAARSTRADTIRIALTDETGRRAAERTALQAQKMEAIGRMAGGIAHDLNNLLTVVSVHDDFLLDAFPVDDPRREDLLAIQNALHQAAALTKKLLAFARPQVLDRRCIAVNSLIGELARVMRPRLEEGVELSSAPSMPSPDVKIDPEQLEQVLRNLVRNAEEAMPGGGRITIETESVELTTQQLLGQPDVAPGWFVRIRVSDSGIGMDPPTLAHAFEPYFTTKPRGESRGLGLATVYAIARQNGGFVSATSQEGLGTSVDVYLPEVEPEEPRSVSVPSLQALTGDETILIAEDEPAIRTAIHRMLTKQGYSCHLAADGEEALRKLEELDGKVGLLLSDVVMPNCNGPELAHRMRAKYPKIPVVFMTGYASADEMQDSSIPASSGVLHKPFTLHALQKAVRAAIDGG